MPHATRVLHFDDDEEDDEDEDENEDEDDDMPIIYHPRSGAGRPIPLPYRRANCIRPVDLENDSEDEDDMMYLYSI